MRNRYNEQLAELHAEMTAMGGLCEEAISLAIRALVNNEAELLPKVFETDAEIDRKESEIEGLCMKLLLQQQPVASDLRTISAALKMVSDMERIGDQAGDIAEISKHAIGHTNITESHLKEMALESVRMVTDSVDSHVRADLSLARSVITHDDIVDTLFVRLKEEVTALIAADNTQGAYYVDLLMVAKYLERIADHAVNIAEWVEYSITGEHINHE